MNWESCNIEILFEFFIVIQSDAENLETGYAMSANILYQAFSLEWEYEEK